MASRAAASLALLLYAVWRVHSLQLTGSVDIPPFSALGVMLALMATSLWLGWRAGLAFGGATLLLHATLNLVSPSSAYDRTIALAFNGGLLAVSVVPGYLADLNRRVAAAVREKDRALEALAGLEASRRRFLADVSHNLGTPLAAIQAWLELLERAGSEAERQDLMDRIRRESWFVSRKVQQLLDLSRWSSAEPELRLEEVGLLDALMEVADALHEPAAEQGTELTFSGVTPELQVVADRSAVREILQILLENAVEHAGPGARVVVSVTCEERVAVEVRDDGVGIPPEDLPELTRSFRSDERHGLSLGLSIAHRLARALGSDLALESEPGRGTTARFSLPAVSGASVGDRVVG